MAHNNASQSLLRLHRNFARSQAVDSVSHCLIPRLSRRFATSIDLPSTPSGTTGSAPTQSISPAPSSRVLTTLYSWPELEPTRYAWYSSKHLDLPLRKDILHRAVIYEADGARQGTASTKWRGKVHGSNAKILPQKGTGRARAGDKKSPIRRGGGVAFGPRPRDFSTELPKKIYDIAWRTALSHKYRSGDLIVLDSGFLEGADCTTRLLHNVFTQNRWGKGNGRSLIITDTWAPDLFEKIEPLHADGVAKDLEQVNVKDLLKFGRLIIDTDTLNTLLAAHSHDLGTNMSLDMARARGGVFDQLVQYSDSPMGLTL